MILSRLWWTLGLLLVGSVVVVCLVPGSDLPSVPVNDKWSHLIAHFVLASYFAGLIPRDRWWKIFLAMLSLGAGIEILQHLMHAGRHADFLDVMANALGSVLGLGAAWAGLARWPEVAAWMFGRRATR